MPEVAFSANYFDLPKRPTAVVNFALLEGWSDGREGTR
jgi:hypothetical protein